MEKVIKEIREAVQKEIDNILRIATKVAEREQQHAKVAAEKLLEDAKISIDKELAGAREKNCVNFILEEKKLVLQQKQFFVSKVMENVMLKCKELPRDQKYFEWLQRKFISCLKQFDSHKQNLLIECNAKDFDKLNEFCLANKLNAKINKIELVGGFIMQEVDGRLMLDCTLEAELKNAELSLRDEIVNSLEIVE